MTRSQNLTLFDALFVSMSFIEEVDYLDAVIEEFNVLKAL